MACACGKNKKQFEVVSTGGKVVFTSASEPTANSVAKRYPDSTVRPKASAATNAVTKSNAAPAADTPSGTATV